MTVPQLRWTMIAGGSPTMNESDLAVLILNILIKMCEFFPTRYRKFFSSSFLLNLFRNGQKFDRDSDDCVIRPMPKVKRILSESAYLPYLVQLLLTFDPIIVEKTATLLLLVMQVGQI